MDFILRSIPTSWRQAYVDYELDQEHGYFRGYSEKVTALEVLALQGERKELSGFDAGCLVALAKRGAGERREPITDLASYVVLPLNRSDSYA